jgi:prepilin-type N-terminal cleavage/methylation domain-containing protein/prepilin-type processing-associated H-X9-DG protein
MSYPRKASALYLLTARLIPQCMQKTHQKAFSLIELLVVMGIIGILAALLFPAIAKAPSRAKQQVCSSNLQQLGVAFHAFAHDHGDRFPQSLPASEGGASDFNARSPAFSAVYLVNPWVFRALSNELGSPRVLKCPSGPQRQAAGFPQLSFSNISYFAHLHAVFLHSDSLLGGDNNLVIVRSTNGPISVLPGVVPAYEWSTDRHEGRGNALMGDGSVHLKKNLPATVRLPVQSIPIPNPRSPAP